MSAHPRASSPPLRTTSTAAAPLLRATSTAAIPLLRTTSTAAAPLLRATSTAATHLRATSTAAPPHLHAASTAAPPHLHTNSAAAAPHLRATSAAAAPHLRHWLGAVLPALLWLGCQPQSAPTAQPSAPAPSTTAASLAGLSTQAASSASPLPLWPAAPACAPPDAPGLNPTAAALTPSGSLWVGGLDGQLRAWPASAHPAVGFMHTGAVRSLHFERGQLAWSVAADSVARFTPEGHVRQRYRIAGQHINAALPLDSPPSGGDPDVLLATDRGDVLRLAADGETRWRVRAEHGRAAFALALRPGHGEALSAGADGGLSRWRVRDGHRLGQAHEPTTLLRLFWAHDTAYTLSIDGQLSRWRVPEGEGDPQRILQRELPAQPHGAPAQSGLRLALAPPWIYIASPDGQLSSWRLPDLSPGPRGPLPLQRPDAAAPTVRALAAEGAQLVALLSDGQRLCLAALPPSGHPTHWPAPP